ITPHAPVGPTRDRLDALEAALRAEGIPLHRRLRGWDARAWPHAHRGFFPFKERIPALLREEQMHG
ncbi:MAG: DNA photolyase, partial [Yonghaparkia sp.]|nr:DNA photolyase [Microcella sp.]